MSNPGENPGVKSENFDSVKDLDPQIKMQMILEVFDLGKDKKQNKVRKNGFIELMGKYHEKAIMYRSSGTPGDNITSRERNNISYSEESKKNCTTKSWGY